MTKRLSILAMALCGTSMLMGASPQVLHSFQKIQLSDKFYCEGAHYGDINQDGKMDVVMGPFWFAGPKFQDRKEFRPEKSYDPGDYSDNFLTFVYDFNQDRWPDILVIDMPGKAVYWHENPKEKTGYWERHLAYNKVENESQLFGDLTGDGKPELIFNTRGYLGYATPDWKNPTKSWTFHAVSPRGKWHQFTHGLGFGDVNGDGRSDLIEIEGWWEQPASLEGDPTWQCHPANFGDGAAQMLVYDFNGDQLADILTCLHPHQYGLAWFQQTRSGEVIQFQKRALMGKTPEESPYGLKLTQMHAFDLVDMDRDGVKDFVMGKRWWAHKPPTDPESDAPAVLYWFRTTRLPGGKVDFVPHLIDDNSGVGTQVIAADLNDDKWPDVIVGNKKGLFVFLHQARKVSADEWAAAQPKRTGQP